MEPSSTRSYQARVVNGSDPSDVESYERLRHSYFVAHKQWVSPDPSRPWRESDRYDRFAQHLAVFEEARMVGYLRAVPYHVSTGFMLDHEFKCLASDHPGPVAHPESVELSRLVIAPDICDRQASRVIVELLLRLLYQMAQRRGWNTFYIVVQPRWLACFERRFGIHFTPLGLSHTFPDGTETIAAKASLSEIESAVKQHSVAKYDWYRSDRDAPNGAFARLRATITNS